MASPESQALTKCYPTLVKCIQTSPNTVADELIPYPILAPQDMEYLNNHYNSNSSKARKILDSVNSQIQINKEAFHQFLQALKDAGPFTTNAVKELEKTYRSFLPTPVPNFIPDTDPHDNGASSELSIAQLQDQTGVSDAQLNKELVTRNLQVLANCFGPYKTYLHKFELTPGNQATVTEVARVEGNEGAMREALSLWKQRNPSAATYRALVNILLELRKGNEARRVCIHVVKENS